MATGLSYYFNDTTNKTTWERPIVAAVAAAASAFHLDGGNVDATTNLEVLVEAQPLLDGWEELIDEANWLSYYFNDTTNEMTWERPIVVAVAAAATSLHLDGGNVDATTGLSHVVSFVLQLK